MTFKSKDENGKVTDEWTVYSVGGGALAEDNIEDYICIKALEDKDDILLFIEQFNEFVNKYNSLNYKEKANEKNNKDKLKNIVANHRRL